MTWRAISARPVSDCTPRHRTRILNSRFLSQTAAYDVASNTCLALVGGLGATGIGAGVRGGIQWAAGGGACAGQQRGRLVRCAPPHRGRVRLVVCVSPCVLSYMPSSFAVLCYPMPLCAIKCHQMPSSDILCEPNDPPDPLGRFEAMRQT